MSIDFVSETLITIPEACRLVPPCGVSLATFSRWMHKGLRVKGLANPLKIETLVVGGRRVCSKEALARFIAAQNPPEAQTPAITPAQRRRQSDAAQTELARMGIAGCDGDTVAQATRHSFVTTEAARQ